MADIPNGETITSYMKRKFVEGEQWSSGRISDTDFIQSVLPSAHLTYKDGPDEWEIEINLIGLTGSLYKGRHLVLDDVYKEGARELYRWITEAQK